jgi:hypothetical protein
MVISLRLKIFFAAQLPLMIVAVAYSNIAAVDLVMYPMRELFFFIQMNFSAN